MKGPLFILLVSATLGTSALAQEYGAPAMIGQDAGQGFAIVTSNAGVAPSAPEAAGSNGSYGGRSAGRSGSSGAAGAVSGARKRLVPLPAIYQIVSQADDHPEVVEKAREFMANPPYNPGTGSHNWTGWCLGFVDTTLRAAMGHVDAPMAKGSARLAYEAMRDAGRISTGSDIPAGAPVFWPDFSPPYGHVAIATGQTAADGSPIVISTIHNAGIQERSLKSLGWSMPAWGRL